MLRNIFFLMFLCCYKSIGQDLMGQLDDLSEDASGYVFGTFKSTRIINSHSVELLGGSQLDFRISHRFGRINSGAYHFWGLDQASIRLGLEYGISDFLNIGIGRSSFEKLYDGYFKLRVLRQRESGVPFSLSWISNIGVSTMRTEDNYINTHFSGRLSYVHQLLLARKFSKLFSFQIAPALVHFNYAGIGEGNNLLAAQAGGRVKISKRVSVNFDYIYRMNDLNDNPYFNSVAIGVDIETGGHVFQLHITNSQGMVEQMFIARTTGNIRRGDIFYGFNISRQFALGRKSN